MALRDLGNAGRTRSSPDAEKRKKNVERTIASIELAYKLGIPTIRVNTGTWGTSKDFNELMKNRGSKNPCRATPTRTPIPG